MPPKVRITREDIIRTAVDIVRKDGAGAINARQIAKALNCSTQPVFSNFATMEELRGAVVDAVEIDEMAYVNAVENVKINHHPEINVMLGDATRLPDEPVYDILLANINRNIIMGDIDKYAAAVKSGGKFILSGFYQEDIPMLEEEAAKYSLKRIGDTQINNWACLILQKE